MITAIEAHKTAADNKKKEETKVFNDINNGIERKIDDGCFSYTTTILSKKMRDSVTNYYSELGYEIDEYNNGMVSINW